MALRSFQTKLLILLIGVLVLLQAATLISVHFAGQRTLRTTVAEELRVGKRVLDRALANRGRQLSESLRVLAFDFAFREATASGDLPTITSVLANHGERVSADMIVLIDLDGMVTADTVQGRLTGKTFPVLNLLRVAESGSEATATVSFSARPYQMIIVPVLAPRPIAWLCAAFEIDESVVTDVRQLTSLEVSLRIWPVGSPPQLISTLKGKERSDLLAHMRALPSGRQVESTLPPENENYATLVEPLETADGSRLDAFLQRSLDEARRPFITLELQIFAFCSVTLIGAIVAAMTFARTVTKPLRTLADGAQRIERGDYVSAVEVHQEDEFGHLATAFNQMRSAIAVREDQIMHQATHDALTGLPNRALFIDRLSQAITSSKRGGGSVGMIMLDIDRFKDINDTLGHQFGDRLLVEIGRRLAQTLRESDTVARLGGDEFGVKFSAREGADASDVARRVATAFDTPVVLDGVSVEVRASLGIALYPLHAGDADTLMKRADIAMYDAKKNQSSLAVYEAGRDEHSLRKLSLMMELRQAIARDELELYFQPKIHMGSLRALHAEALVRWKHPRHGILRPDEFIPLAEQSGNVGLITKWVLRSAIRQCAHWKDTGLDVTMAVNLSALDLFDSELPAFISGLLAEAGLTPSRLVLEITESAVMKDPASGLKILTELGRRGVALAIDDFGTGYSSLAHLKRLPVDELKIDKSFVQNLNNSSSDDLVIVRSTIELGHNMGLIVIAEGVETLESWQILKELGCDMAQGYFMSPPLPAEQFTGWFRGSPWGANRPDDPATTGSSYSSTTN